MNDRVISPTPDTFTSYRLFRISSVRDNIPFVLKLVLNIYCSNAHHAVIVFEGVSSNLKPGNRSSFNSFGSKNLYSVLDFRNDK